MTLASSTGWVRDVSCWTCGRRSPALAEGNLPIMMGRFPNWPTRVITNVCCLAVQGERQQSDMRISEAAGRCRPVSDTRCREPLDPTRPAVLAPRLRTCPRSSGYTQAGARHAAPAVERRLLRNEDTATVCEALASSEPSPPDAGANAGRPPLASSFFRATGPRYTATHHEADHDHDDQPTTCPLHTRRLPGACRKPGAGHPHRRCNPGPDRGRYRLDGSARHLVLQLFDHQQRLGIAFLRRQHPHHALRTALLCRCRRDGNSFPVLAPGDTLAGFSFQASYAPVKGPFSGAHYNGTLFTGDPAIPGSPSAFSAGLTTPVAVVPEPGAAVLMLAGLALFGLRKSRHA